LLARSHQIRQLVAFIHIGQEVLLVLTVARARARRLSRHWLDLLLLGCSSLLNMRSSHRRNPLEVLIDDERIGLQALNRVFRR
jgi:hypothetical protein